MDKGTLFIYVMQNCKVFFTIGLVLDNFRALSNTCFIIASVSNYKACIL